MVDFEQDIKNCIKTLENGNTIVYPTETVWGIGCDATDYNAVDKVFELKQRPREKSMIILLADARDILQYVAAPPPDIIAIVEAFDRPTTVIYNDALNLADNAVNADGSIAIRVTTDPFCKALIKRFRKPIVSTSANISGQPAPTLFEEIAASITKDAGYCVSYRRNQRSSLPPSRIIRIDDEGSIQVIRP